MNEELKVKINRGYTERVDMEDYGKNNKVWSSSHSEEILATANIEERKRISAMLYDLAKSDVEQAIVDYKKEQSQERIVKQTKQDYKDDNDL